MVCGGHMPPHTIFGSLLPVVRFVENVTYLEQPVNWYN